MVDRTEADKESGQCTLLCVPKEVILEITYYQITKTRKQIQRINAIFAGPFSHDMSDGSYKLTVNYFALSWQSLLWKFAFLPELYVIVYIVIGIAIPTGLMIFWYVNRRMALVIHGKNPSFDVWAYISLIIPPVVTGFVVAMVPTAAALIFVKILINGWTYEYGTTYTDNVWVFDVIKSGFKLPKIDPTNQSMIDMARNGRTGICFLTLGVIQIYAALSIMIPRKLSRRERNLDDKRDRRELARNVWTPTAWKKLHAMMMSTLFTFFFVGMVDFSFNPIFGTYIFELQFAFKLVEIAIGLVVDDAHQDAKVGEPINVDMGITDTLITIAATD
jgi:hypothetical protein